MSRFNEVSCEGIPSHAISLQEMARHTACTCWKQQVNFAVSAGFPPPPPPLSGVGEMSNHFLPALYQCIGHIRCMGAISDD